MPQLSELIRAYCEVLEEEHALEQRKQQIRELILQEMDAQNLAVSRSPDGSVQRTTRFKLHPRRPAVLALLNAGDLFPFAQFAPLKVKSILVPKYGRERLLPLFDIEKSATLLIKRARLADGQADPARPQHVTGWSPPLDTAVGE
jgi:hypothetical protein